MPTTGVDIPVYESTKSPGDSEDRAALLRARTLARRRHAGHRRLHLQERRQDHLERSRPRHPAIRSARRGAGQGRSERHRSRRPAHPPRRRSARQAEQFKLDFPIKPGETRSASSPGPCPSTARAFSKTHAVEGRRDPGGGAAGCRVQRRRRHACSARSRLPNRPSTRVKGPDVKFDVEGTGLFNEPARSATSAIQRSSSGQSLSENLPKLYGLLAANSTFAQSDARREMDSAHRPRHARPWFYSALPQGRSLDHTRRLTIEPTKASTHARGRG